MSPRPDESAGCQGCGRQPGDSEPAWLWSLQTDDQTGRTSRLCPECTRSHSRSIEARLDESWWD